MEINIDELGCVYCLSNPGLPSLYKIGKTDVGTAEERALEISKKAKEGLPFPYKVEFSKKVINSKNSEKETHDYFKAYRVNTKKEFFNAQLQDIATYFNEQITGEWEVKPSSNLTLNQQNANTLILSAKNKQVPQNTTIKDIHINNLTDIERDVLIDRCIKWKCMELRMLQGYYFIDSILKGEPQITKGMKFNAIINSPEMGYMIVSSNTFHQILHELTINAPQTFIELEEIFM
jgi:hypothetical protein